MQFCFMHTSGSFRKRVEIGQKQQIPYEQPDVGVYQNLKVTPNP